MPHKAKSAKTVPKQNKEPSKEIGTLPTTHDPSSKKTNSDLPNTIKRGQFTQDENNVRVVLLVGKKLKANDIDVEFTPSGCKVVLTDGRRWQARFFREIDYVQSGVQMKQMKVFLNLKKKDPGHWMDLEYIAGQSEAAEANARKTTKISQENSSATKKDQKQNERMPSGKTAASNQNQSSSKSHHQTPNQTTAVKETADQEVKARTASSESPAEQKAAGDKENVPATETRTNGELSMDDLDDQVIERIETAGAREAARCTASAVEEGQGPAEEKLDLTDLLENEAETENGKASEDTSHPDTQDGVYRLSHLKHDFFEKTVAKPNDTVMVTVFVKQMVKDSAELSVHGREVGLKFKTTDSKFLSLHQGSDENTVFLWTITVVDELVASQCAVKARSVTADVTLRKADARRWCALEAVNSKDYAKTSSTWKSVKSTAKVTPLQASQSATASTSMSQSNVREQLSSQSKVGFTDSTATKRTAVEHAETESTSFMSGTKSESKGYVLGESSKDNIQKPTCMVSPLKPSADKCVVPPGYTGLDNMGNTCFMNSILQVLANTTELRNYFLDSRFQKEINYDNVLGSGGKLAVEFATLLKVLWSGKRTSYAPTTLKKLVAQKKSMFSGFAQHDAQEYMSFLLDGLHEDVNRVKKKPYVEQVDSGGRPDEVVAEEAWTNHRKRDNSFLVDLFQGQYKSTLVCPVCEKLSVTFDPFMHLPVPLPKKQRLLPVVFMSRDPRRMPVKYLLKIPKDATVENLKEAISTKTAVSTCDLRVFEAWNNRVHTFFQRGASLSSVSACDKIIVHEVLSEKLAGEPVKEIAVIQRLLRPTSTPTQCACCRRDAKPDVKLKRCSRCLRIGYCDSTCQKEDWQRHKATCRKVPQLVGMPFLVSLPHSQLTFSRLYQLADSYSRYSVDIFQPPQSDKPPSPTSFEESEESTPVFRTETMFGDDSDSADSRRNSTVSNPMTSSSLASEGMDITDNDAASSTVTSTVSNDEEKQSEKAGDTPPDSKSAEDGNQSNECNQTPTRAVLGRQQDPEGPAHMFKMKPCHKDGHELIDRTYLKDGGAELLDLEGVNFLAMDWKNDEKCRPHVLVQTKEFEVEEDESVTQALSAERDTGLEQCVSLFMEPEVLSSEEAWYCPQCQQHRQATKQMSLWRLPSYLIIQLKRFSYRNFLWCDKVDKMVQFPTRGLDMSPYFLGKMRRDEVPPIYDLTGVVNHYGGILGGHYTAYARTPDVADFKRNDIGWRLCDDSRVSNCTEDRVVTQAAYVLFYRRRDNLQITTSIPPEVAATCYPHIAEFAPPKQDAENEDTTSLTTNDSLSVADSGISLSSQFTTDMSEFDTPSFSGGDSQGISSSARLKLDFTPASGFGQAIDTRTEEGESSGLNYTDMDSVD